MTERARELCRAIIATGNNGPAICDLLNIHPGSSARVRRYVCDVLGCERDEMMETLEKIDLSDVEIITTGEQCVITRDARRKLGLPSRDMGRKTPVKPKPLTIKWPDYSAHNLKLR